MPPGELMAEGVANQDSSTNGVDAEKEKGGKKAYTDYGLNEAVLSKLEGLFESGKLSAEELDERALEALKEFHVDGALVVLKEFLDSSLEHVTNKSAYLCGIMKTYRQKSKIGGQPLLSKAPDEDKIKTLLDRTGYSFDVTTGQRKYGGPPPDWDDKPPPVNGCELFVGRIPKNMFEDELIPVFETHGQIWDCRLMMDPLTSQNRGYAFLKYCDKATAQAACKKLDNYEIKYGRHLKVNISVPNLRLFVGNIPKSKSKEEILEEFSKLTESIHDAIVYNCPDDKRKNRGFCFLEYESHKAASLAKRKLGTGRMKVFGCDIIVDWADPQEEPDEETMSKVKVLYVRNLTLEMSEDQLKEMFDPYGKIDRVKKIKDYAFIHFAERESAVKAMEGTNGKTVKEGMPLEVSLAKPPSDKRRKDEILRNRERRMVHDRMSGNSHGMGMMGSPYKGRGSRPHMPSPRMFGDFDYYRYNSYRGGGGGYHGGRGDPYHEECYSPNMGFDFDPYGYNASHPYMKPPMPERMPPTGRTPHNMNQRGGAGRGRGSGSRGHGNMSSSRRPMPMMRSPNNNSNKRGVAGKRKFDSGQQAQGAPKRRMQNHRGGGGPGGPNSWGSQPIPQQPHGNSGGDAEWYQDSYGQQWC